MDKITEIIPAIEMRRARRALSEKEIPKPVLQRIMTAATYAPSCSNNQSWRFLVATKAEALSKVREALSAGNYWAKKAPVMVVVATKKDFGCQLNDSRDYAFFDCGLAVENLLLQAFAEGLYAHPMAGYDPLKVKQAFGISDTYTILTLIAIGYPGESGHLNDKHKASEISQRQRKPMDEVISYEKWYL